MNPSDVKQFVVLALLFFVLSPGVLLSLPNENPVTKQDKMINAGLHALVFVVIVYVLSKYLMK